ncbi:hypothetical protein HWV62_5981 [Athelia sp. TMB]|nr:hypothetical protein HWV62_5981 [Athelia sp. TMB]
MTAYFRSIFGGGYPNQPTVAAAPSQSKSSGHRSSSKSHSRSYSTPSVPSINPSSAAFIYAATAASTTSSSARSDSKRSQSFSARRPPPSPLRYGTYESGASYAASDDEKGSRGRMYRRASYKTSDPASTQYSTYAPSSGYASSRSNSSSSFVPGVGTTRSASSSRGARRPSLRANHTWDGSHAASSGSNMSSVSLNLHDAQRRTGSLHMHPLLAATRLHNAPISYDILYTPSTRTILDRNTHLAVPSHTLAQPATDPPTSVSARIVLRSDKFPWPVVVGPSSQSGSRFYLGGSEKSSRAAITNLDLLYALHTTLLTRVTPAEWEALGRGSRAQRKVTEAYEKRCKRMGGGWEGGVRRIDWLHGKTRLVGIEVDKYGQGQGQGKLVFGKA